MALLLAGPGRAVAAGAVPDDLSLDVTERVGISWSRGAFLSDAQAAEAETRLVGVALLSPLARRPIALPQAEPACATADDDCLLAWGRKAKVDAVVVISTSVAKGGAVLRARKLQVATRKESGKERAQGIASDPLELEAAAQALVCKLLVPAGCQGELAIEDERPADGGGVVVEGGLPLPTTAGAPAILRLPLGLHELAVQRGAQTGPGRRVPVLLGKSAPWRIAPGLDGLPVLVAPGEPGPTLFAAAPAPAASPPGAPATAAPAPAAPAGAVSTRAPPPVGGEPATDEAASARPWPLLAGAGTAGLGAAALLLGVVQGARSSSLLNDATTGYQRHGGAFGAADLEALDSGNAAARTANLLFVAGGILVAAGAAIALAF
jgi:hypothetical protein